MLNAGLHASRQGHTSYRRSEPPSPGRRRGVAARRSECATRPLLPGDGAQPPPDPFVKHSLLDEAIERRRHAERTHATRRLRYLDAPHRLRLVSAFKQLALIVGQCSFKWSVCSSTVMPSMPAAPLLRFTCANACFRFSRSTTASIDGPAAAGRSRQAFAARASVARVTALGASPFAPPLKLSSS